MKKAIASTLAVLTVFSAVLFFPAVSRAVLRADACWDNWGACRIRSFEADMGVVRTTVALTLCDVSLGKCMLSI